MRLQIDFESKMIHIIDDINDTDFNMIAFTHKLGDFKFAGILQDDEEIEVTDDLLPTTSVANFYENLE